MKNFKFMIFLSISFILYAMLGIVLEKIDSGLIYNHFCFFLSSVIVIGLIIMNIANYKKSLKMNMFTYKKITMLSFACSLFSSISIFVVRVILSLVLYGFPGLKESVSWFALFAFIGFGGFFILYFIGFICFKNIGQEEEKVDL